MHFWTEYGMFLAKSITMVISILILFGGILAIALRTKGHKEEGELAVKSLNEKYEDISNGLSEQILDKKEFKKYLKEKKSEKKAEKESKKLAKRLFVLCFKGDLKATAVEHFREEVTAVLSVATPEDEVFVKVESAGGMIQTYGLAASQLARIRERKIPLTVSVDTIAASGGYLMACVANHIIAAPFSIVGSIGVVAQLPNFHRFLKQHNIDFEQITAGEFKRTLSLFGQNTEKGRQKFQEEVDEMHELFKEFIQVYRPQVDISRVSTGEYWLGTRAVEVALVDELSTSDDYLLAAFGKSCKIHEVTYACKQTLKDKLTTMMMAGMRLLGWVF